MSRPPSLVRSGWWVVIVAAILVTAIVGVVLRPRLNRPARGLGDGRDVASYGFDLSTCLVDRATLVASGMARDGLKALDRPASLSAAEVDRRNNEGRGKFLLAIDRVVGVAVAGESRAYPLRFLRWHEVVNDELGGAPVLVTYSGLADAAMAASRDIADRTLSFAVSGLVSNSTMLLYDRSDDPALASLWSQLDGRAVAGPAAEAGLGLGLLPAAITSWELWRDRHPHSTVLAPLPELERLYKRDPYHSYFGSDLLRFPVDPLPPPGELALKDRVVIVTAGGRDHVLALPRLAQAAGEDRGTWTGTVDGVPIRVRYDLEVGTALVEPLADPGPRFATRQAFWFAWHATHPDTPARSIIKD